MNRIRLLFIQMQMLHPSIHHKWKEIINGVCKQPMKITGSQILTKIQVFIKEELYILMALGEFEILVDP